MTTTTLPKQRMKVPEFLAWANEQLDSHYELVDGEIVAMAPDCMRHNLVKLEVAVALREAVKTAGLPCTVFTDGMGITISDETTRLPDASVQCGVGPKPNLMVLEAPLIVVEVASRSNERQDVGDKLIEYFSMPSIRHYLIVLPEKRAVVHHMRNEQGKLFTYIGRNGDIRLDPPGMTVSVAALLGPELEEDAEAGR